MTERPTEPDLPDEIRLPDGLLRDLVALHRHDVHVQPDVDRAVLTEARAGFARRRRFWIAARAFGGSAAAAAAAAVVLMLYLDREDASPTPVANRSVVAGDVDGSGRVDIVDALLLAKRVESKSPISSPADDLDGNGTLDRSDVQAVAAMAVSLDSTGGGGAALR